MTTNQPAVQVYTGYWLNTPRKVIHGGPYVNYTSWSAVAIEQEGYIDAINTPEWGVDQICESGEFRGAFELSYQRSMGHSTDHPSFP